MSPAIFQERGHCRVAVVIYCHCIEGGPTKGKAMQVFSGFAIYGIVRHTV
jgi:hypothetical protein